MTRPVHTVKYAQANFKRYQVLAIIFALLTVTASLLAALSGIQVKALQKSQVDAIASHNADQKQREKASEQSIENLTTQLETSQQQLAAERQNVKNLIGKVADLERRLAATEAKLQAQQQKATAVPTPTPVPKENRPEVVQPTTDLMPTDSPETEAPAESGETQNKMENAPSVPSNQGQNPPPAADQ